MTPNRNALAPRSRRSFVRSAGVAGVAGLGALAGCTGDPADDGVETIDFVLTPAEADVDVEAQWQPLFDYIEEEVDDVEVEPNVAADFAAVAEAVRNNQADIADVSPEVGIYAVEEGFAEILGIREAFGTSVYFTFMTTNADSEVEALTDAEGETVALADSLSATGSLIPLMLLSEAGLDIGDAPSGDPVDFTVEYSDHATARESVLNREDTVLAGTGEFATMPNLPEEEVPEEIAELSSDYQHVGTALDEGELRLIEASEPMPNAPIIVREAWDADAREEVVDAMLSGTEEDWVDEDADQPLWFTGLDEGEADDYELVAEALDYLGVEFQSQSDD
ncbi:PhnD/SsuA/transferrin family substrate-binding protein [Natronorarus salvus]|uniref:PhnD/SsuA/transferrin family substrate-binding protein n=1 Tax=Natronorarus salvus TaxID=3117733 RepID=UPI002F269B40